MPRAQGCAGAAVQDVRTENYSLHFLHFRRPWRSYAAGAGMRRSGDTGCTDRKITPCIFCTSAVPGGGMPRAQGSAGAAIQEVRTENYSLHFLHFRHPWRWYAARAAAAPFSMCGTAERVCVLSASPGPRWLLSGLGSLAGRASHLTPPVTL
ncbi:hypothetical protein SAMN02745866_01177 [Alteromonadaceae bacterium Bs31]|nr:hypothetical protein SAMN02745866_01177 [Alteromonadaceae bacterium Bs31]